MSVIYLALCIFFGIELVRFLVPDTRRLFYAVSSCENNLTKVPDLLFYIPAGTITGIMTVTMFCYYCCLGLSYFLKKGQTCETFGIAISFALFGYLGFLFLQKRLSKAKLRTPFVADGKKPVDFNISIFNCIYYGFSIVLFTVAFSFIIIYSYRISGENLMAGASVFSDLSPHTAMVSSFGKGTNFPTQYMHFSGDGIQYHFFFYFLSGILEYLGMSIDFALNVPSILTAIACFCLLGLLSVLLSGRRLTFVLAPILVLFRSSLNIFYLADSAFSNGSSLSDFISSVTKFDLWFGQTPYDNWGVWAVNVFANQRHLLLGTGCVLILLFLFIPYVRRMCISCLNAKGIKAKITALFFNHDAWLPSKNDKLSPIGVIILSSLIVIEMPFFHGSALIAGLLVLFGMAVISKNRLSYIIAAFCAIVSAEIQTRIFAGNNDKFVSFKFLPGFVVENPTFKNVMLYILIVTGLTFICAAAYILITLITDIATKKPTYRALLFVSFLIPTIFAFTFSVSKEILANHKFIQISLILCDIFVASLVSRFFVIPFHIKKEDSDSRKTSLAPQTFILIQVVSAILAVIMLFGLTANGISEWFVFKNINKVGYVVNTNSDLVAWITENTDEHDVFLTPNWSMNRFFLAGRATYYGWPYYAWSAGHDTDTRLLVYNWLITGCNGNLDEFVSYCKSRNIRYLIADPEFYSYTDNFGQHLFNGEFFAENLKQVAYFSEDNNTIVYQIY